MGIVNNALIGASGNQGYNLQRSLRFRSSASAYLKRTLTGVSITKLSYSVWTKRGALGSDYTIQGSLNNASNYFLLGFNSSDQLDFQIGGTANRRRTTQVFRDPSAWYHIYLVLDTTQATADNRIKMYVNGVQVTAFATNTTGVAQNANLPALSTTMEHDIGGYNAATAGFFYDGYLAEYYYLEGQALDVSSFGSTNTLTGVWQPARYTGTFTGTNSCYLPFNPGVVSYSTYINGATTSTQQSITSTGLSAIGNGDLTAEFWYYCNGDTGYDQQVFDTGSGGFSILVVQGSKNIQVFDRQGGGVLLTSSGNQLTYNAWHHVAFVRSGTACTLYIDGISVATGTSATTWTSTTISLGCRYAVFSGNWYPANGYLNNARLVAGTAVYTSNFTPPTTNLSAITNTQILTLQSSTFVDNSGNSRTLVNNGSLSLYQILPFLGLGSDLSGNANNWILNNISQTSGVTYDSMTDVPTLTSPTAANFAVMNVLNGNPATGSLSDGNLTGLSSSAGEGYWNSTIAIPSSGKWYWEFQFTTGGSGIRTAVTTTSMGTYSLLLNEAGRLYVNGADQGIVASSYSSTDVMGVSVDVSTTTIKWYKNSTLNYTYTYTAQSLPLFAFGGKYSNPCYFNFGQRPFAYTPPTGYVALNTYNLPTSTIVNGAKEMGILLYTGDGTTSKNVTGLSFQPDLTYVKNRSAASDPTFSDTLRGITKVLYTDATSAESTAPSFGYINSILSTGFNVNSGGGTEANFNKNGQNYVGWTWKAGQGTTSSNTAGTITSTVSVNANAGLSMVTYTVPSSGSFTVGHGLGVAPSFVIHKSRSNAIGWPCYHAAIGNGVYINLNLTNPSAASSTAFGNTSPTSTVMNYGDTSFWGAGYTYVAYCFAPIAGYSAFGSYTGNGSTDGTFIYLGFRPKFFMIKVTNATNAWLIVDSSRSTYNVMGSYLIPNASDAEGSATLMDFVSNGVKMRNTFNGWNASGETFIYAAFAENPFKNALAR